MLFAYRYVPHDMDRMQQFMDFIFFAVWCKAPKRGGFGLHLFAANTKLHAVMESFHYSDSKGADFFNAHVEAIYDSFQHLSPGDIRRLRRWYKGNNDLEKVCANDPRARLASYADIQAKYPELAEQLRTFFKGLYDRLGLADLKAKIGSIDDHYKAFTVENNAGKCPFCGINDLFGKYHSKREAYDHYLPKALYPFNSVNFHNLVPACPHCNSSYKGSKNAAFAFKDPCQRQVRRKVFYPFSTNFYQISPRIRLQHADYESLLPKDIELAFDSQKFQEQIETWKDVYGIEERYKAKMCAEDDGKYWVTQVLDECQGYGLQPADILNMRVKQSKTNPYADCNFIRAPFLEACDRAGVF